MRHSKSIIISASIFLCLVVCGYMLCILPLLLGVTRISDNKARLELAGKLDTLILGASRIKNGAVPMIIDKKLGCCSYNLAETAQPLSRMATLFSLEMDRNPIKTVIIEVSESSLNKPAEENYVSTDCQIFWRLDGIVRKVRYFSQHVSLFNGEFEDFLADCLMEALGGWPRLLRAKKADAHDFSKGHQSAKCVAIKSQTEQETQQLDFTNFKMNLDVLSTVVSEAKRKACRVVVVVAPISNVVRKRFSNWDMFQNSVSEFAHARGCEFYNFNMIGDVRFNDECDFSEETHLCAKGAEKFSVLMCDVLKSEKSHVFASHYVLAQ